MSVPGEIDFDPTNPDGDGAGAEGGAMGGDSAGDTTLPPPLQPDRTQPFEPGATLTPYHDGEVVELSNLNLDDYFEFEPDDIPVVEVDYIDAEKKEKLIEQGKKFIKDKFRKVDFKKLGPISFGKKPENKYELVRYGAKGGEDRIFKKDRSGLLKSFIEKAKNALGSRSEELLAEENQEISEAQQRLKEEQEKLKQDEKFASLKQSAADEVKKN